MVEAVGGAVFAGEALVALEVFDVRGVFDLMGAVERARMDGEHGAGVEDAHGTRGWGEERTAVDDREACRTIAALTAIVQTMMHEVFSGPGNEGCRESFDLQAEEDELLAMAIANELTEDELVEAFGRMEVAFGTSGNEISACPVTPHLRAEQRMRARIALLALEEADHAHTLAVRMPDRPGVPPLSDEERVRMGEEAFLGRIEIDVLHEHEGWSGFTTMAKPEPNERLEHLPEPWRKHAARRLPELRTRISETLERKRVEGPECR